jgi:hypothetical protein
MLGSQYEYAIFEMTFDEDLYYVENWPCGCISDETVTDCTREKQTAVEEYPGTVTLEYDTWTEVQPYRDQRSLLQLEFTTGDFAYLKFHLSQTMPDVGPCPIVAFSVYNYVGNVDSFISNDYVPDRSNYMVPSYILLCLVFIYEAIPEFSISFTLSFFVNVH